MKPIKIKLKPNYRPSVTAAKGAGTRTAPKKFHFLSDSVRYKLEQALLEGRSLGLIWATLPALSLFVRLYGEDIARGITANLDNALKSLAGAEIRAYRFLFVEKVDEASFIVLFYNGPLDLESLKDMAMRLRLSVRHKVNQEVVKLTGQNLDVAVGCSLVAPSAGQNLEAQVFNALCDARRLAEGTLNLSDLSLMSEFRELIRTPQLYSVYQPIVNLSSAEVMGWEALARGPAEGNFASPKVMFDFAEEVGSIFALEQACREQAVQGVGPLKPGQKLFLNIHPQTMGDPGFRSGETLRLIERHGLKPSNVVFEITERHSIQDFTLFHRTLEHYRDQGYLVAIDDVGTGYSGLCRIAELRPDFMKVDMSLVSGIDTNPVQRALLESLVTLAEKTGSSIIAEGIETATELSSLMSMGVHYGQGFFLARPASPKPQPACNMPLLLDMKKRGATDFKCSIPVRDLVETVAQVGLETKVREVKDILDSQPMSGVVVVEEQTPVGLVMSHTLDRKLGTYYGTALYWERSVSKLMDSSPLIVEGNTPAERVAGTAMARERFKIFDHIIVTESGQLLGVVSVQKMLDTLARVQVEMAKGANPLSGLPGNVALEQEIERRCGGDANVSIIYVDLDNFKVYNDTYGFDSGDKMIRLLADILVWSAQRHGGSDTFVGHIGGDDLVVICQPVRADRICRGVIRCFARLVRKLYRREDLELGYVLGKGRDGQPGKYPLVTVSLGIIDCQGVSDLSLISRRAAEVKRYAKSFPGNVYVRDRRGPLCPESQNGLTVCQSDSPQEICKT